MVSGIINLTSVMKSKKIMEEKKRGRERQQGVEEFHSMLGRHWQSSTIVKLSLTI